MTESGQLLTDYECRYCGSSSVVPVLDKRMDEAPAAGNKYRRHCLSCARWLPMCSENYFKKHPDPHVLPTSDEPERENLVPLEEYDYAEEIKQVEGRMTSSTREEIPFQSSEATIVQRLDGDLEYSNVAIDAGKLSSELPTLIAVIDGGEIDLEQAREAWEDIVLREADLIRARRRGFVADEE